MSEKLLLGCKKCKRPSVISLEEWDGMPTGKQFKHCDEVMWYYGSIPTHCLAIGDEQPVVPVCRICGGSHLGLGLCRECCVYLNDVPNDGTMAVMVEEPVKDCTCKFCGKAFNRVALPRPPEWGPDVNIPWPEDWPENTCPDCNLMTAFLEWCGVLTPWDEEPVP